MQIDGRQQTWNLLIISTFAVLTYFYAWWSDQIWIMAVAKPVPVLAMAAWLLGRIDAAHQRWILIGLGCSLVGDIFMVWPESMLLPGLAAFGLTHLCYTRGFWLRQPKLHLPRMLPFLLWGGLLFQHLEGGMGDLRIAVAGYTTLIVVMMWRAAAMIDLPGEGPIRARRTTWGAVSFGISDSAIAFQLFVGTFAGDEVVIMLTYWLGQWGIMAGMAVTDDDQPRSR